MFPSIFKPKNLSEIAGHTDILMALTKFKKSGEIPNLLFIGEPGTGKTSIARLFIEYLHGDSYKNNYLEINASDDNGVDVIRTKVKEFATRKSIDSKYPRIVFLDEIDKLTDAAQNALKKPMESCEETARFILCSNTDNVIAPLRSRCISYTFGPLSFEDIRERIYTIHENDVMTGGGHEGEIDNEMVDEIAHAAGGDLRAALNLFQAKVYGLPLLPYLGNETLLKMEVAEFDEKILFSYSAEAIIKKLFKEIRTLLSDNAMICECIKILADADFRTSQRTIKTLQILDAFLTIKDKVGELPE